MRMMPKTRRRPVKKRAAVRYAFLVLVCAVLASAGYLLFYYTSFPLPLHSSRSTRSWAKSDGKSLLISQEGAWQEFVVAGVVVDDLLPGSEHVVSYEMYLEWFHLISKMNANTVFVRDLMSTDFYSALHQHNTRRRDPLFLLQGITLPDSVYDDMTDAFSGQMAQLLTDRAYKVIDAVHGSIRYGTDKYLWDVSDWTLAYVVGSNWDPDLVLYTNDSFAHMAGYRGKFISTWPSASAFETVLATVGNRIFSYETRKYGEQRMLGFANWARTDPLFHDSSWSVGMYENLSQVNMELITVHNTVHTGVFLAYHLEPNYPLFLSFDPQYSEHIDNEGNINPFRGYLEALVEYHRHPLVVTSFGVPSSRGVSNIDERRSYNQGGLTEREQGQILETLYRDIVLSGTAGGCVLSWTDSWAGTSWNTQRIKDVSRSVYWSDFQTSSQSYGLLACEPGTSGTLCHVDGDVSEWANTHPLIDIDGFSLKMMYDEKYLYFSVQMPEYRWGQDIVYIPLDLTPNSGSTIDTVNGLLYDREMDFVIVIEREDSSRVLVQEYYNSSYALYGPQLDRKNPYVNPPNKDSGEFSVVTQRARPAVNDEYGQPRPLVLQRTGQLRYGNSNPASADYDSLSDFMHRDNYIELRIPWGLLNFWDPSLMAIHDDYYRNYGILPLEIDSIWAGLTVRRGPDTVSFPSSQFKLSGWGNFPTWHFRLKESYAYMQMAFAKQTLRD